MKKNWRANPFAVLFLLAGTIFFLNGCLMTRDEISEDQERKNEQQQMSTLQKNTADQQARFADVNEDLRDLHGKVEANNNAIQSEIKLREKSQALTDQQVAESNKKVQALQEEVQKLENQVSFLNQELTKAAANPPAAEKGKGEKGDKKVNYFTVGETQFAKKEWKDAILNFQKYRDSHPTGKRFALATYKIGLSFQELGMKDEARTFFEEVINKFPDSSLAKQAKDRLKKK